MIVPSLEPIGVTRMAFDLAEALKEKVETHFFFFEVSKNAREIEGAEEMFFTQLRTFEEFDVVHSHGFRPNAYIWYHSKSIKAQKLTTLHSYVEEELTQEYNRVVSAIFWRVWKYVSAENNEVVALSKHMRNYYMELWETEGIKVIPSLRPIEKGLKPKPEVAEQIEAFVKPEAFVLCSLSYASEQNGLDQIIRLLPLQTDVQYIHIGSSVHVSALQKLAEKLQVADRCLFLDSTPDAYTYLKYASALVVPARSHGFPMALMESVQLKVPAIVSDIPVFKEYFSKEHVTFFQLENITSLSKAIEKSKKEGDKKAEAALAHYKANFSAKMVADRYLSLYEALLA
jgi:glycosyltransferase involved in cell wall biosynthesis